MNNDGRAPDQPPSPSKPAARKTPDADEQKQSARGYLRIFVALVVAVLLTSGLALPWKVVPLVLGVAAVVVGIMTLIKVLRSKLGAVPVFVTSLGLAASAMMVLGLGLAVATWDSTEKLESCLDNALTMAAEDSCKSEFSNGILPR